jgi:hypothetical protein
VLPADFAVSPALTRELKKIRGAAVAIIGFEPNGKPHGVAGSDHGDFYMGRGVGLFIVSDSREQIAQTVARLQTPKSDSLATQTQFSRLAADRENALVFAYVNGQRAMQIAAPHLRGQEAMMAQMLLDLAHLESASAALGTSDKGIHAQAKVVMAPGHRNLAYAMVRTAPVSKKSLTHVPAGAAAVAVLGLNSPGAWVARAEGETPSLTAMDIGREVFANVEEISLFVLPAQRGDSPGPIPEIGMVAAVKDPAKSEALWDQLLSLAAMFGPQVAQPPVEVEVEGRKAKEYRFQGAPPIVVARLADGAMAAGTRGAVSAAVRAEGAYAITGDPQFKPLLDGLKPESSKAVLVHVGRAIGIAAATPGAPAEAQQIAALLSDLKAMVLTHEGPNEFVIRAAATGLPNVPDIAHAVLQSHPRERNVSVRVQSSPPRLIEERSAPLQKP